MEHDNQAEEDHEEVEEDGEMDEEEQDTLFEVPPRVGDKSDSDGFVDSEEEAFEGDDMSEDGLGLGPTPQEQETVLLSSGEDEARKVQRKSAKKRKGQDPSIEVEVSGLDLLSYGKGAIERRFDGVEGTM